MVYLSVIGPLWSPLCVERARGVWCGQRPDEHRLLREVLLEEREASGDPKKKGPMVDKGLKKKSWQL